MSSSFKNTRIRDTGFLKLPVGTTAQRPSVSNGQLRYNSTLGYAEYYTTATANGSAGWAPVVENKTYVNEASGPGHISWDGPHKKHTFAYDLIYSDNKYNYATHASGAAAWTLSSFSSGTTLPRCKIATDGNVTVMFDGYIQSGPSYWSFRIKRERLGGYVDYFPSSSGSYYSTANRANIAGTDSGYIVKNDNSDIDAARGNGYVQSSSTPYVHMYASYIQENISVRAGDILTLEMTSSTGGGTPTTGSNQQLYVKNFKVFQTEYIFKPTYSGYVEVLCVGGGGGGGAYAAGGGGGAGGLVYRPYYWVTAGTEYTIKVGRGGYGGWGQNLDAQSGANSQFGTDLVAIGGGRGGLGWNPGTSTALDGGSGGGAQGYDGTVGTSYTTGGGGVIDGAGGSLIDGQGSRGGRGKGISGNNGAGGGGGGAGRVGFDASDAAGGQGGQGYGLSIHKNITGAVQGLAGGGGGARYAGSSGGGQTGGGSALSPVFFGQNWATDYFPGAGGGGSQGAGGSGNPMTEWGGNGSPGIVVVRYVAIRPKVSLMFTKTSKWVVPIGVTSVDVLVVGGGGGGGYDQGGGGGGGGLVYAANVPVTAGQAYSIVVGAGGAGSSSNSSKGSSGGNSSFLLVGGGGYGSGTITGYGGGGGGSLNSRAGLNGGSGGGSAGSDSSYTNQAGGDNSYAGQGFDGGAGNRYAGGGGGGAGGAGEDSKIIGSSSSGLGGVGGPGLPFAISGSLYYYSCGGGGGSGGTGSKGAKGGFGGFGGRGAADTEAGGSASGYGSGGGGAHTGGAGGAGSQGIVILRYSI